MATEPQREHNFACTNGNGLMRMLTATSTCDVTPEEAISSLVGFTAAPFWLMGHFLIVSARSRTSKKGRFPPWVTWSLLPHCLADVMSCAGAVMAPQFLPQIVFAVIVLCIHSFVAIVIVLRHLLCNRTVYDLRGDSLVKTDRAVSLCARCPLKLCTLSLVMVVTLASCEVTADVSLRSSDVNSIHNVALGLSATDNMLRAWPWWEITGEVFGGVACVGHWLASLYEVFSVYKARSRHARRQAGGIVLMIAGNACYVATVLWRPLIPWLHALPWTLARAGLLGINVGMLIQLWRKTRRKCENFVNSCDANKSLLSTTSGSDEDDVLWDSQWRTRLCTERTQYTLQQFQPVTPVYPDMHCFGQGKSPQPHNRTVTYDLLHSTDTSCSRTAEQDTELEFEANHATHFLQHNPQRDISLPGLTPLTPETRHHRVKQWVEKTSPDDDGHVMVMADEHAQYRQHSGSFSQPRVLSSMPSSRKNSAIF